MKLIISIILTGFFFISLSAQTSLKVIGSSGDYFEGEGEFNMHVTIGEVVISAFENGNINIAQGFHHGNNAITAIEQPEQNIEISVYPNPVVDRIVIESKMDFDFSFFLSNAHGQVITKSNVGKRSIRTLSAKNLLPGIYYLKITDNYNLHKTYKIIKQ